MLSIFNLCETWTCENILMRAVYAGTDDTNNTLEKQSGAIGMCTEARTVKGRMLLSEMTWSTASVRTLWAGTQGNSCCRNSPMGCMVPPTSTTACAFSAIYMTHERATVRQGLQGAWNRAHDTSKRS